MITVIGERINTSRQAIRDAVKRRDAVMIADEAERQMDAGAAIIDVNCGTSLDKELDDMLWLIATIQAKREIPLCLDSPSADVLGEALKSHKGTAIVNSISAEKARYEKLLPLVAGSDCSIVALTMDERGMPKTAEDRFQIAQTITAVCEERGVSKDRLFFDPLVRPVSSEHGQGPEVLKAIRLIGETGLRTVIGLSNISFGLPNRRLLNRTFLAMACAAGLSACIIDPLDSFLMSSLTASAALLGQDEYSMNYIGAFREQRLV